MDRHHALPDDLCVLLVFAFAVSPLAEHDGRVHVGRGEGVGLVEQRDHAEQDRPDGRDTTAQTGSEDMRRIRCTKLPSA